MRRIVLVVLGLILVGPTVACGQGPVEGDVQPMIEAEAPETFLAPRAVPESREQIQLSFAPVVREVAPAVVNVFSRRVVAQRARLTGDPFFDRFFGQQQRAREVQSLGSGVIVDPSGVIVTNNHVVEGAEELRVVLNDRREFEAEILVTDERTDLAVLRIVTNEPLPVLPYNDAGDAEVGDLVLAIGNPFGVGQTVTSGIVSALARTDVGISDYAFFIQTDAAVNPGNSGGALVNLDGELIGVNTAIFSRSGGSVGIGFAIPVEMVRTVVNAALRDGELIRPWLGARLQPVTNDMAQSLGFDRPEGAIVAEVYEGGPADRAGLRRGDIVTRIDGVAVNNEAGARFRFATRTIGETAELTVLRDGAERALRVGAEAAPGNATPERITVEGRNPFQGIAVVELSPAFNEENGLDAFLGGVMVASVTRRSAAAYYGFQPGDRIVEVAGRPVRTPADLLAVLQAFDDASDWPIVIERGSERYSRTLRL